MASAQDHKGIWEAGTRRAPLQIRFVALFDPPLRQAEVFIADIISYSFASSNRPYKKSMIFNSGIKGN
jgi:hypothetical protein